MCIRGSCKSGHPSRCENLNTIGAYVPGAYAEYIKLPEINFVKMADSMSYEQGALVEPATVAIHGLYQTSIKMGYEVAAVSYRHLDVYNRQVLQRMMEFLNNKEVLLKCKELSNEETVAYLTEQLG